jgi:hypothetical protein
MKVLLLLRRRNGLLMLTFLACSEKRHFEHNLIFSLRAFQFILLTTNHIFSAVADDSDLPQPELHTAGGPAPNNEIPRVDVVDFVFDATSEIIMEVEEYVPLLTGVHERLYSSEDWAVSFKGALKESMGDMVSTLTATQVFFFSTAMICGTTLMGNLRRKKEYEREMGIDPDAETRNETEPDTPQTTPVERRSRRAPAKPDFDVNEIYGGQGPLSREYGRRGYL